MYNDQSRNQQGDTVQYVAQYDPFVVQTLQSIQGSKVVVQTTEGSIRGEVADVKPDHVVIQSEGSSFFIRIQQIVWVMPT
nr:YuzF family protein [Salipaludibacillus keqinensis]